MNKINWIIDMSVAEYVLKVLQQRPHVESDAVIKSLRQAAQASVQAEKMKEPEMVPENDAA